MDTETRSLVIKTKDEKDVVCPHYVWKKCQTLVNFVQDNREKSWTIDINYCESEVSMWLEWMKDYEKDPKNWKPKLTKQEDWKTFCWISFYLEETQVQDKVLSLFESPSSNQNQVLRLPQYPVNQETNNQKKTKHLSSLYNLCKAMKK